ncbi:PLP-dependent aminotransferase family protein [Clostridium botulinum]|uniref:GntR family transcriptional regulator n=3 Tax=Clostridium botulinum TaxID=1491 RepID=A0A9Q1UWN2_CLOBO|nr:PLP-dependent aminotransferase family protein [Clostridium botulinum]AEB75712.1 transcription regulator of MocR family [Clostridium botulinum BKT015925]KEI02210.1 GntR family transcriptional regulator [Clostridium botulinum D str. 16868]KEI02456.1 GntR family transcriptional regulator [Clostridium botulinum C/D str. Sp77]KLU76458.1 GntR family transcriptional regulator [Clostridium botulinum V891]KOA73113.1 GntR family transcriptional regulator [Clostridium botulinum]
MDKYYIKFKEDVPKYIQIVNHVKKLIYHREILDGEKLPAIRILSKKLGVNNVTIVTAYNKLEVEGFAIQKIGSGTFAKGREDNKEFLKEYSNIYRKISSGYLKDYIDFTGETTSGKFFPVDTFKEVLNKVLDRDGAESFTYQDSLGYEGLRKSINKNFWKNEIDNENILIVSGAQQGIDIAAKAIININDYVLVEKPTYSGALNVFKSRRANILEVEIEENGLNMKLLRKILKKNKIKCFYIMSYFQNPTGNTYSTEDKLQILNLAEEYNFYIIEDDYLSELIYDENIKYDSFKSLDIYDRVIYIKSFSKIFLPGIRMGYLIPPKVFSESVQNCKVNTDITTSSLMQRALELYINEGYWKRHMAFLNESYKNRYYYMKECIENILSDKVTFKSPGGGLNFYLKISNSIKINAIELFNKCKNNKVIITPGVLFYKSIIDGEKFFRVGFSVTGVEDIKKGINIINKLLVQKGE